MVKKTGTNEYDVIVVGGGHAGCEAYAAACRIGARALLVTPGFDDIACQPCNPAVGGPGKGHLVREVVALGGKIGKAADMSGIQFRTLNARKGPAVRATRVQTDSNLYICNMLGLIRQVRGGEMAEDRAIAIGSTGQGRARRITGVQLEKRGFVEAKTVVIATGTFLRGKLFVGSEVESGGRRGSGSAVRLAGSLEEAGLPMIRLKTGTCPRLDGRTVDNSELDEQRGDFPQPFFDPSTTATELEQLPCHVTHTNDKTFEIVNENIELSAMYSGAITGIGPRYCPSIETKIARFPEKRRHQIFLEPEDREAKVIYPSGLSTSLPAEVQEKLVRSIKGLERARIVRYGYAVEYDAVQPRSLLPTLETDGFKGLFLAGQILGTSGYEEAAALGLFAGANAALAALGRPPLLLSRDKAYLGVMIDDLTVRGVDEPYRMFTSRAEYRLLLREDNADERLLEDGVRTGLTPGDRVEAVKLKLEEVRSAKERLKSTQLTPSAATNSRLSELGLPTISKPTDLLDLLGRGGMRLADFKPIAPWLDRISSAAASRVEVDAKYQGYIELQIAEAEKLKEIDRVKLPLDSDFGKIPGLRPEVVEKLCAVRPTTLGEASRIPGVTPAAVQILHVYCRRRECD